LTLLLALLAWGAVIGQYIIILNNHTFPVLEATIRFFSFFTILTNTLVAIYFSCLLLPASRCATILNQTGALTAVTVYIIMVGSVYQIMLRQMWQPQGMQLVIDEMLHTVIPTLVVIFWFLYEHKNSLQYRQICIWLLYPVIYLAYTLIHGHFSNFYPYYFIDVSELGLLKALKTSALLMLAFVTICCLFIFLARSIFKQQPEP
jgi:hypothetical protein